MKEKLPRWSFVKVYLNPEELEMLEEMRKNRPMSEYFREILRKEYKNQEK